jgi:hypothetical protein
MPVPLPAPIPPSSAIGGTSSFVGLDIIQQAMWEIGAIPPGETPSSQEAATGLIKLNRMLDLWNADGRYVYANQFIQNAMVPSLQPHTIGPGQPGPPAVAATWYANQRPVKIVSAEIILNTVSPPIRYPCNVRDAQWWADKRSYAVQGTLPTDVYYEPDWPNGSLYIWPVTQVNYPMELQIWTLLNQIPLTGQKFSLPPGYLEAVVLSLAVSLCPSFEKPLDPTLASLAIRAVRTIQAPNTQAPRIATRDNGLPKEQAHRASFNSRTGSSR